MAYRVTLCIDGFEYYEQFGDELDARSFAERSITEGYCRRTGEYGERRYYPVHRIQLVTVRTIRGE